MKSITRLLEIMRKLRDPEKGCPWDKQQDFMSILPYTLEEAYEVADAIERNDMNDLCCELGDLLFQVVYHAQLASEQGSFTFADIVEGINAKLVNRHPHVFGNIKIETASQQSRAWQDIKSIERSGTNSTQPGILDQVSPNLPALTRAQKLQSRAANAGFDWSDRHGVLDKIREEINELDAAISGEPDTGSIREEMGDFLFACVNFIRHMGLDAESTLRAANRKFENRFRYIEEQLNKQNKSVQQASLEEMEKFWQQAKKK